MKINGQHQILEPGDIIYRRGDRIEIKSIVHQEYWNRFGFIAEFYDTNGIYRNWKQHVDGGMVLNHSSVPEYVKENIVEYFSKNLNDYEVKEILRASDHPNDSYLYMVIARRKVDDTKYRTGNWACWTCWNESTQSLNFGHTWLESYEVAKSICNKNIMKVGI